jgi:hypothetical protein
VLWRCKCDCGTIRPLRATSLSSGNSKSCGCLRNELSRNRMRRGKLWELSPHTGVPANIIPYMRKKGEPLPTKGVQRGNQEA